MSAICFTAGAGLPLLSAAFIADPSVRLGALAGATTREWAQLSLSLRCQCLWGWAWLQGICFLGLRAW